MILKKQDNKLNDFKDLNTDISVIMTLYKRPEHLEAQLEAIENQTLKPKEILLYQDGTSDTIAIPEHIKHRFNFIEISPENKGVWARFNFARKSANSKYVCVFDDDTIPGKRWLENCMEEMLKQEGLYGAIGILTKNNKYDTYNFKRVGWNSQNKKTLRVDFVGHSWFLKKEWLDYLFENTEELQKYKVCAEDMTLSYKLQEHGINTYIPKQPASDIQLSGSLKGFEYGADSNSLFVNNGWENMTEAFDKLVYDYGFKTVEQIDKKYFRKVYGERFRLFYKEKQAGGKRILHIAGIKISYTKGKNKNQNKKKSQFCIKSFLKYAFKQSIVINKKIRFNNFDKIDVSIIIPVYNQYKYTLKCLNSIYKNTKGINYEIIIVDDCSTDKTKDITKNIKNIKYIRNEKNQGYVKSCNTGAAAACGEYIYFLNNDTFVLKNCIESLVETFKNDSRAGIAGSKIIDPHKFLVQSAGAIITPEGYSESLYYDVSPLKSDVNKLSEVMYVSGASLLISKSLWDKLGGFDEIYSPGYYEETDLCMRCKKLGYKVLYQPTSEILHFGSITFGKVERLNKCYDKNRAIFLDRYSKELIKQ